MWGVLGGALSPSAYGGKGTIQSSATWGKMWWKVPVEWGIKRQKQDLATRRKLRPRQWVNQKRKKKKKTKGGKTNEKRKGRENNEQNAIAVTPAGGKGGTAQGN